MEDFDPKVEKVLCKSCSVDKLMRIEKLKGEE